MPTTYTHYRLGRGVRKALDGDERRIIEANIELFQIGLHGPDLLFYYKPLGSNPVNRMGHELHNRSGVEFLEKACRVIREQINPAPYLAYIYGVICHFSLDVCCHGYIAEAIRDTGISHAELEAELDREFMEKDGFNPISFKPTGHIRPSQYSARIIAPFFPDVFFEEIYKAEKGLKFYCNMLVAPSKIKREIIFACLRKSGNYDGMYGMIINYDRNPKCIATTDKLVKLYNKAGKLAVRLIKEFRYNLDGSRPFDSVCRYSFDPQNNIEGEIDSEI